MYTVYLEQFKTIICDAILPAGLGGLVSFILGLKAGLYRNNNHKRKLTSELLATATVAIILVPRLPYEYTGYIALIAFFTGFGCTVIMQSIRITITKLAEAYLDELLERRK